MSELLKDAIDNCLSCADCKHCRRNKGEMDRYMDDTCYHPDIMQIAYYGGKQSARFPSGFICNYFDEYIED